MFQLFHLFLIYVANVLSGCLKSRLECCTALVVGGVRPTAATYCCCWGAAVGQPTWVPHAGAVLLRTRAPALALGEDADAGSWDGMRAGELRSDATSCPDVRALALPIFV